MTPFVKPKRGTSSPLEVHHRPWRSTRTAHLEMTSAKYSSPHLVFSGSWNGCGMECVELYSIFTPGGVFARQHAISLVGTPYSFVVLGPRASADFLTWSRINVPNRTLQFANRSLASTPFVECRTSPVMQRVRRRRQANLLRTPQTRPGTSSRRALDRSLSEHLRSPDLQGVD